MYFNILVYIMFLQNLQVTFSLRENQYKIIPENVESIAYDKEYLDWTFVLFKINRTTYAINGTMHIFKDLPDDASVHYKAYEFLNNEYRPFPINVKRKVCDFVTIEYGQFLYPELMKVPNSIPPPRCPIRKGKYWFNNYMPSDTGFPIVPAKRIKLEIDYFIRNKLRLTMHVVATLDRDAVYRAKYGDS